MSLANFVGKLLVDADFPNYFPNCAPSALDCGEPVVGLCGPFEREVRTRDEERGHVVVGVLVVRDTAGVAESDAEAAELAVRRASWEPHADCGRYRVCGVDTTAPVAKGRDASGRWVWSFEVRCTVARSL